MRTENGSRHRQSRTWDDADVEKRTIRRTGHSLPVVGMGSWKTFDVKGASAERSVEEVVSAAVRAGTTLFDTSPMYGHAEQVLARAVGVRRSEVLIADKVWTPSPTERQRQIQRALAWYQIVDIYQVHNLVAWREHLPVLADLKEQGKVRVVGATHYQHSAMPELMSLMESGRIDLVQIPYNVRDRLVEQEVLPLADELGIGVLVMQPLDTGALVRSAPDGLHDFERFGVRTWAQILLKWILSDPRVHSVLPATSNARHAEENAAAGSPPWFDAETREWVARYVARLR
jgi:aryl-alcohol dehydrogenase-like predicted oxidoreductase